MRWVLLLASYLAGAFPTSYAVARLTRGIDLSKHGSGNLGATNAYRVLGWRAAAPIFLLDIAKGFLPVILFPRWDGAAAWEWALAYGAAAIIGHVYSVYVRFKGGKGVATSAGVFLALAPASVLAVSALWGALLWLTGYVSLASIAAAVALPILVLVTLGAGPVLWLAIVLGAFVVYKHRSNIGRLVRGEEHRFRRRAGEAR